jgi:hypothetical protein
MGPRGFWIALAIVLFYLIARPHVGSLWKERRTISSPNGRPTITIVRTDFPSYGICENHVATDKVAAARIAADLPWAPDFVTTYDCIHRTTLLWGW